MLNANYQNVAEPCFFKKIGGSLSTRIVVGHKSIQRNDSGNKETILGPSVYLLTPRVFARRCEVLDSSFLNGNCI